MISSLITGANTLYPPNLCCTSNICPKKVLLEKEIQKKVVVYTRDVGTQPAYAILIVVQVSPHAKQPSLCSYISTEYETTHHNNYNVKGSPWRSNFYPSGPAGEHVSEWLVGKDVITMIRNCVPSLLNRS